MKPLYPYKSAEDHIARLRETIKHKDKRIAELEDALRLSHFHSDVLAQYHERGTVNRHESCKMMSTTRQHPLLIPTNMKESKQP